VSAPRPIPDFTAVARRSFESAVRKSKARADPARRSSVQPSRAVTAAQDQQLVAALLEGQPFRVATRRAGLFRVEAKRRLERSALRCVANHAESLHVMPKGGLTHSRALNLIAKDHTSRPLPAMRRDAGTMWTHLWIHDDSGLVVFWLIGPWALALEWIGPRQKTIAFVLACLARARSRTQVVSALCTTAEVPGLATWLSALADGQWKKVREQWLTMAVLAAGHNFCASDEHAVTPAMRTGWASRPWGVDALTESPTADHP
jgi:hypothetical protein